MIAQGKVFKFWDHINTDEIIPARYLNTSEPDKLAEHVMEDADKDFPKKMQKDDIIVAGIDFGCGSSREHAPIAIKTAGISCVIAKSFARIFFRNSINIGLPIIESPEAVDELKEGDELKIDFVKGEIENLTQNKTYKINPFPEFMQKIMDKGGLMNYVVSEL